VVVSMAAPCPVRTFRPMPRSVRSWTIDQMPQVPAEPVEFPDDQGLWQQPSGAGDF
jgi:hypothetical protein